MSLTSPKLTESLLLLVAVAVVVVSGLLAADLFASVVLVLDKVDSLSLTQSVLTPVVVVASVLLLLVEFAAVVHSLSVAKQPEELVVSTMLALHSVVLVALVVVAASAVAVVLLSVPRPPEELVVLTTPVAYVALLASNVEANLVAFAPLVLAESALDRASPAAAQSVAEVATSALAVKEEVLANLTDTDTTRDGE